MLTKRRKSSTWTSGEVDEWALVDVDAERKCGGEGRSGTRLSWTTSWVRGKIEGSRWLWGDGREVGTIEKSGAGGEGKLARERVS